MDVDLDGSPSYILQGNDVLNGGTDNCGVINFVSASPAEIFCDELGTTVDVLVTVNDGNGNIADCMAQVTVVGLPCDWSNDGGIGCTENSASYDSNGEVFTLTSENCTPAYPYTNDQMAFVSQELCGDGEIIALVTNVDGNGYGGVMMRESNDPSAPKVAISTDHVNRLLKEVRLSDGYPAWPQQVYSLDKFWLKIERKGLLFRAYASVDGVVWIPYIFQYMQMDDCIDVGLFTYSNLANMTVTSTFESVSITNSGMNTLSSIPSNTVQSQLNESTLDVGVYPNPAINELNINLADYMDQDVSIQVYNNLGQLVINKQIEQLSNPIQQLDVSPLEAGSFLLNLRIGDQQISKRIMILND
jgi:regulation of enolase protein 1 (concanavalin A-like superfamily)